MLHIRPSEVDGNKKDAYLDSVEILKEFKNLKGNFHFLWAQKCFRKYFKYSSEFYSFNLVLYFHG